MPSDSHIGAARGDPGHTAAAIRPPVLKIGARFGRCGKQMIVTGVQPVGSKGVSALQGTVADPKDRTQPDRAAEDRDHGPDAPAKPGEPQPIVMPRSGLPLDQRPVSLRHQVAAERYRSDGSPHARKDRENDGDTRRG
jgi:hypothetical protein